MPVNLPPAEMNVLLLYDFNPQWSSQEKADVANAHARLTEYLNAAGLCVDPVPVVDHHFPDKLSSYDSEACVLFNWCDGIPGYQHSEWIVARHLEQMRFVFTGSSSATLALSYEKHRVKEILERQQVPTPRWRLYTSSSSNGWHDFPAIVKPAIGHCSEWVTSESVAVNEKELKDRISYLVDGVGVPALVEDFIDGREFHVSLWGNGRVEMLPPAEMDFSALNDVHDRLCSFDAKFMPGSVHYENIRTVIPSTLDGGERAELERVCMAAYKAIGCRDYGRIDLRLRDGVFYVLDINPNPDISEDASMASAAEFAGYSYGDMAGYLIALAAKRHPVFGRKTPHGSIEPRSLN
ncbi:MAG: ATP-grasp domain-containing protein [Desulfobacterales bacterium]|nr:ATP-grasp domain-containing protein [Desulfobacterales bacterium]